MPNKPDDLILEIRDRFREAYDYADPYYTEMIEDLEFLNGDQWPSSVKADRLADGRPCLQINKLPAFVDQLDGDMRQNTPAIKIKPVDSGADPDTAEVLTGLIRNIENQSMAKVAYATARLSAIQCGRGAWRVVTEYADDDVFEQDIRIKRIRNPFTVFWDPASQEWDRSDARYCFVTEKISREEFKRQYPKASTQEFPGGKDRALYWGDDKTIRVVEYWRKQPVRKTLYLLRDPVTGETYVKDETFEGYDIVNTREVETFELQWYKASGAEILEGPTKWLGKLIPVVDVLGKEINIENKTIHRGIIRHAKDSQRLYNFSRSHDAETTALAPKSPYLVTSKQIGEYQRFWDNAHKKNYPYLPYEPDEKVQGGRPYREPPISLNTAIVQQIITADQELHDTTGLQLASLGKKSNEKSGIAIRERVREGDRGNFAYSDAMEIALTWTGKILIELIPKIYDTARVVRILGEDGSEDQVQINQEFVDKATGEQRIHDLSVGKYDVAVSIGPSYQTQREEAADGMLQLFNFMPDPHKIASADIIVKNLDWPGASELEKRFKRLLPPGMADEGGPPPPAPPPDPMQILALEKEKAEIQKTLIEVQKVKAEIEKILAENRLTRAETAEKEFGIDTVYSQPGGQGLGA